MNVKYHAACGVLLDASFGTKGLMTLCSILPDLPLVYNEIKLLRAKELFDEWKVDGNSFELYLIFHSLLLLPTIFLISPMGSFAWLIHQVCDWFTHTGRFTAQPLYPFPYRIKFGRNILK